MRESSKAITLALQVGIFIFAGIVVIVAFSFRITDTPIFRKGTMLVTSLDDATGVFKNSKVKMAGIDIGVIKEITLEGGKARIKMLINQGVDIPNNAQVIPRPLGILGDKYLEVVVPKNSGTGGALLEEESTVDDDKNSSWFPGPIKYLFSRRLDLISEANAQDFKTKVELNSRIPTQITNNEELKKKKKKPINLKEGESIESLNSPATLDDLTRQLGDVSQDLKAISGTLRELVEGKGDQNTPLGRTFKNTEKLTGNLNSVVVDNKKDLRTTISALSRVANKLESALDGFDEKKIQKDLKRLADSAGHFNKSLENVEKITSKIENGEGTIGKLINDPSSANELNRALRSINLLVDKAQRTQMIVDLNSEYMTHTGQSKSYVGLSVMPKADTGYLAQVVVDSFGMTRKVVTRTRVDGGAAVETEEIKNDIDALKFSLQYYKRLWNLGLRIGIFESRGGIGLDLNFFKDSIQLGADLFNFSHERENPLLKIYGRYHFGSYFYVLGGVNDVVARNRADRSFHVGIGLRFVDDDLKALSLVPSVN